MKVVKKIIFLSHIILIFLIIAKEVSAQILGNDLGAIATSTGTTVPVQNGSGLGAQEPFLGNSWTQEDILPYEKLILKPVEELVRIYLGLNIPQVEDITIQNWINTNVNTWQVPELIQKEELALRIHIKHSLIPFNIGIDDMDTVVEAFASLIEDGLEGRDIYSLEEYKTIIEEAKGGDKTLSLETIDSVSGEKCNANKNEDDIAISLSPSSSISSDNPYISVSILPKDIYQDFSNLDSISFNISGIETFDIEGAEFTGIRVELRDTSGRIVSILKQGLPEDGNIELTREEIDAALLENDTGFDFNVANIKILLELDVTGRDIVRLVGGEEKTRHYPDAKINSESFTISELKIKIDTNSICKTTEESAIFLSDFLSLRKWGEDPVNYLLLLSDVINPDVFGPFLNSTAIEILADINTVLDSQISCEDNFFLIFGILSTLGLEATKSRVENLTNATIINMFETIGEEFDELIAPLFDEQLETLYQHLQ
jgi:hypothetical protein